MTVKCGYVAIVGRPNVGKSTLLNNILGQKLSITSHKPQTTRHRILGVKTESGVQAIYVDTPGLHLGGQSAINRYMNRAASSALAGVDVVVFVLEALRWTDEDQFVLSKVLASGLPVIVAVNKIDKLEDKEKLLPYLQELATRGQFREIIPVSAYSGSNIATLEQKASEFFAEQPAFFPEDQITDRSERFLAAEIIREKLIRNLEKELPYSLTVEIEQFKLEGRLRRIGAVIWTEREGQKKIIIGKGGAMLKKIGAEARKDMEHLFDGKVFLQLWVKVKQGWSDDERALRSLGYNDFESE